MNEQHNPWKILGEKKIYENPWIKITEFDVVNPSGGKGIYGKVHLQNIATGALPLDEALNIYLVGQYRFTIDRYSWEIPEGGGKMGVDPVESAKRELLERMVLMGLLFQELRVKAQDMEVKPDLQMVGEEEVLLLVLAGKRSAATAVLEALAEIRQGVLVARAANQTRS